MMEILHLSETTMAQFLVFIMKKTTTTTTNRLYFHSLYNLLEGRLQKTLRGSELIR